MNTFNPDSKCLKRVYQTYWLTLSPFSRPDLFCQTRGTYLDTSNFDPLPSAEDVLLFPFRRPILKLLVTTNYSSSTTRTFPSLPRVSFHPPFTPLIT